MSRLRRRFARLPAWAVGALLVATGCEERTTYQHAPFAHDPAPVGSLRGRVVVTNSLEDVLSVAPPETPGPVRRLPVGTRPIEVEGPHHAAVDPLGRWIYVNLAFPQAAAAASGPHGGHGGANTAGLVVKIDVATGGEVARVAVDPNPGDSTISPDGNTVFVTHYDLLLWRRGAEAGDLRKGDSALVAVDTQAMRVSRRQPLCPAAHGVRVSADGGTLYAACGPDQIAVVDLRDPAWPVRLVQLPGTTAGGSCSRCPYALSIAPDGTVWVSSLGASNGLSGRGRIDVFDPALPGGGGFDTGRSFSVPGSALFVAFGARGGGDAGASDAGASGFEAYVPEQGVGGDRVRVLDPGGPGVAPSELARIGLEAPTCLAAHMLAVAPGSAEGWLVCEGDRRGPGTLVWLDLAARAVRGAANVGVFPDGVFLLP